MTSEGTPNPVRQHDAAALIGVLAVLEGLLFSGRLEPESIEHLRRRLRDDGLIGADAPWLETPRAIGNLNQRLRYSLGEDDSPPESIVYPNLADHPHLDLPDGDPRADNHQNGKS